MKRSVTFPAFTTESALAGAVYPVLRVWTGLSMKANTNTFSIRS